MRRRSWQANILYSFFRVGRDVSAVLSPSVIGVIPIFNYCRYNYHDTEVHPLCRDRFDVHPDGI
jgi:hypothetical protein